MSNGITVIKRNGDNDSLNLAKVHKMVEHACEAVSYTHLTLPTIYSV